ALAAIFARISDWMDRHVWDGIVRDIGAIAQFFGRLTTSTDERVINAGVDEGTVGAHGFGRLILRWHSGQIHNYLGAVDLGILTVGAEYFVCVDGLSLLLVLLTSVLFPFAFSAQRLERGACALLLVMQAALYGTFTAQNFILWFLFYEMSLIPAFLLIKIYG